jgi:hypothetical protein
MPSPGNNTQLSILDPLVSHHRMLYTKKLVPVTSNDQGRRLNLRKTRADVVGSIPYIVLCVSDGLPQQASIIVSVMVDKATFKIPIDFSPRSKKPFTSRNGLIGTVVPNTLEDKGLYPLGKR